MKSPGAARSNPTKTSSSPWHLKDVFDKGDNRFSVVESTFETPSGEEIQRQLSTFVMLGGAQEEEAAA